jgi:glycosyltransferase involved in cell wall biosynthesis
MGKPPLINITLPVLNEEAALPRSVPRLCAFLSEHIPHRDWEIVIADNGSTDGTPQAAAELAKRHPRVRYSRLEKRGRGLALRTSWTESQADILSYMDVDLSTDLAAFPILIEALASGGYALATGSRLLRGDLTVRGWKREMLSRGYNFLVHRLMHTRFSDAQCGFKAITRSAAQELLPLVENNHWFFDTELLVLAEKLGHRICDLPVQWTDDPDSRVRIGSTMLEDVRGLLRLRRTLPLILQAKPKHVLEAGTIGHARVRHL